ncbi:SusC/RagA family TonB-linked outer membrane protein [Tunicatimonas pelagia]|uniref:SusC/RagA family TonB-linked outer membrane protein n=1 Tax=Tunicatimonas pelagia TaxID=931531 RepID=UPI00266626F1|nr:TonB-dependent receptor [Tunicatimonas pelagia]WKN43753.1 TonB-dependent receptor [Tunicatimonas pelagia]
MMKILFKKTALVLYFLCCGMGLVAHAQQITGTITDTEGEPLVGATILEKGTSNGTVSDIDGKYAINVTADDAILIFSYIGYISEEETLNSRSSIDIALVEDIASLDEIVVIGYGTQRRQNVSAAISTISTEAIEGRPVADFTNAIQGQVAGLQITNSSGRPGAGTQVQIRGTGSITGNSNPLYVIDGTIISTSGGGAGDPLATINPADIESINVLKDASAAAIYGARAANGVIIVTTKRGASGKANISLNAFTGVQQATNTLDLLNAQQYQQVYNQVFDNAEQNRIPNLDGTTFDTSTDWQDAVLRTANISNYEISADGGGENTRYFTSLGRYNEEGIIIGTGLERTTLRLNTDTELGKFKIGNSMTYSRSEFDRENAANGRNVLAWSLLNAPTVDVFNPNTIGGFGGPTDNDGGRQILNPVASQNLVENEGTVNRFLGNVYAEYEIISGLRFRTRLSADVINFHNRFFAPYYQQVPDGIPGDIVGLSNGAEVDETRGESISLLSENILSYTTFLGKNNFDFLLGYNIQDDEDSRMQARNIGGFISPGLPILSASTESTAPATGRRIEQRTLSYIGRVVYDYDNTLLATFNFRRDGSSIFTEDNYWDNFFSGSLGLVLSNLSFLRETEALDNLKIRGSYGFLGNDRINANAANSVLNSGIRYIIGRNQQELIGVAPTGRFANPNLQWEKQRQLNIGLDLGLFNKLTFTADYFVKTSEDLLLEFPLPSVTGFSNVFINAGEVENRGVELSLNFNDQKGDLRYGAGFNVTFLDNEVTQLANGVEFINQNSSGLFGNIPRTRIQVGEPLFNFFGYQADGIYQSQEEIDAGPTPLANTEPGDIRFADISGPDGVPDGEITEDDRTIIGDATQDIQFGFNLSVGYKGFDVSAQFQGVYGNDVFSDTRFYTEGYFLNGNLSTRVLDAWTPENTNTTQPRAIPNGISNNNIASSYFVEDGSYLRLKNLQIGYSFPQSILGQLGGLSNARVYLAGQNVFTITNYSGFDPEQALNGFDPVAYPQSRRLTVGVQLSF